MAVALDPFESYLKRAADLFEAGDIVQAGQIWQAILKKRPEHEVARAGLYKVKLYFDARATQGGLVGPKPSVEVEDARTTQGALPRPPDPEVTRLLEQGCILYDAGHVEDAVTRWVQVLAKDPDNVLAKGYISGARRTLGQPAPAATPLVATSPAEPPPAAPVASLVAAPALAPTEESDRLLRDGCTLFDMGQLEDALKKWEQILARDPAHALARAYVQDARRELGLPPLAEGARPDAAAAAAPEPNPLSAPDADSERTGHLIRDGVQLYDLGMIQEAKEKWQQVLALVPGHADAEAYLAMARKDLAVPATVPAVRPVAPVLPPREPQPQAVQPRPMALELVFDEPAAAPEPEPLPQPVTPPSQLTARNQKVRKGLNLPELLRGISLPAWVASPAFILGTIAGLVILVIGSFYFLQHRKDQALKQAVAAFRASAVSPVARSSEIANLEQTPEAIRQEAQAALGDDPLLAYYRAKESLRLNPTDAVASQLLDRAKANLAQAAASAASIGDFEKQLHGGDLESAERIMTILLSQNPDDRILIERASRLSSAMILAYASKERWAEAETRLQRNRAMSPEDRSWSAKLLLLTRIQAMPRKERAPWIQLLS